MSRRVVSVVSFACASESALARSFREADKFFIFLIIFSLSFLVREALRHSLSHREREREQALEICT